jgi:16S rRNA (adenine1518-N6/adenine1519-N6)-dimethyltransferase
VTLDGLPPLREGLAAQGLSADKGFGQHFLLDLNLTRKIARLAGPLEGHGVLEVGPGPGGLTRALLEEGAAHMVAVEKDARFLPMLREIADAAGGRLTVACEDALKCGPRARGAGPAPPPPRPRRRAFPCGWSPTCPTTWRRRC